MKTILAIVALTAGGTAWAVNPAPVTVANPSLNVNVTNTPLPVSVTNATTNQSVTVTNSAANPIPVTVTPAEEPFQVALNTAVTFAGSLSSTALVTVPSGKTLVIEHVSAAIDVTGADGLSAVNISIAKSNPDDLVCSQTGATADGMNHFFSCSALTKYYVGAGQTLSISVATVDNGGAYTAFISGHYVPAP